MTKFKQLYFLPEKPDLEDLLLLPSYLERTYVQYRQGMSRVRETDAVYSPTPRQLCTLQSKKILLLFFLIKQKIIYERTYDIKVEWDLKVCLTNLTGVYIFLKNHLISSNIK